MIGSCNDDIEMLSAPSAVAEFGPTVLVIDDDVEILACMERLLERHGFQVAIARNGAQGLAAVHHVAPDAVLTDILMPGKDGIETICEIRRQRHDTKIVAMSGGGNRGDTTYLGAAMKLGADATIAKPFDMDSLLRILSGVLGERTPARQH